MEDESDTPAHCLALVVNLVPFELGRATEHIDSPYLIARELAGTAPHRGRACNGQRRVDKPRVFRPRDNKLTKSPTDKMTTRSDVEIADTQSPHDDSHQPRISVG
jgi:hypothetical protein